jgi:uncharacterized protein (TIGR02145 family)
MKLLTLLMFPLFLRIGPCPAQVSNIRDTAGNFFDNRDNQTYKWVKIGSQTWMAENLKFKADSGAVCYSNKLVNCDYYGLLYSWEVALLVCPTGWSLPSDQQWGMLEKELGIDSTEVSIIGGRGGEVAIQLKSRFEWQTSQINTDKYGFNILPAGYRNRSTFNQMGSAAFFWTSTVPEDSNVKMKAWYRLIHTMDNEIHRYYRSQDTFMSIRCVKNQ